MMIEETGVTHGRVEVLVYNVSHVDLVMGVAEQGDEGLTDAVLGRPKFNRFYPLCMKLLEELERRGPDGMKTLSCPFNIGEVEPDEGSIVAGASAFMEPVVPVGFDLSDRPVFEDSWGGVRTIEHERVRKEGTNLLPEKLDRPKIIAIYLPLVAQVLATWLEHVRQIDFENSLEQEGIARREVFLISGAGTPRNRNLDIQSNSTKGLAEILKVFINKHYPTVTVRCLDSGLGVFHYDRNVAFCKDVVLPEVEQVRRPLVVRYGHEWRKRLRMTIALTDGSAARLAALNASLRTYKPNYLHMWQLKTFWYEHKFFRTDLLYQSFETMEAKPPIPFEQLDKQGQLLVEEMRRHKEQFEKARSSRAIDELGAFWLRKTRKVVLSVLMVQAPQDKEPRYFRGMNLEVSMPTGSLCSERNVIGTALASDQTLRRQDFIGISVLSMTLDPPLQDLHESPRGASVFEGFEKELATSPRARPISSSCLPYVKPTPPPSPPNSNKGGSSSSPTAGGNNNNKQQLEYSPDRTKFLRRPRSYSSTTSMSQQQRFQGELNPIQPCGACNEWLKKIAEVNPTFKVFTFPNSDCLEAFVSEVE